MSLRAGPNLILRTMGRTCTLRAVQNRATCGPKRDCHSILTGYGSRKRNGVTLFKYQCFALGMKVNQTILLQYKLLGLLSKSGGEGNPQGDAVYFLIYRCIIGFNLYFQGGKRIYITEYYQVIHNCYIINKSNKIKSPLSEAFSFLSFRSQHSHILKFFSRQSQSI